MTTKTKEINGEISIHTENILPIIKKWLYSEHEIFVRELVSNAYDAINKYKKVKIKEGVGDITEKGKIELKIDKEKKTLTFADNGLGMDADEIQKYINQIAFSGAEDFIKKYKDKDEKNQIIGHFGLGFYSAFMAADNVEINSLSYKKGAQAVNWQCDGSSKFSIKPIEKKSVGTEIVLHMNTDNENFLEETKITELVKKYANFLPVQIEVDGKIVNDQNPLWLKQPTEVKDEEYKEFYQKMFPFSPEPLFWIHLNVDYPFNLKGILYFPKILHELDSHKGQVKLFCQQVFVTDKAKEIIPEFLTLLQGTIDCPDIPLNVSRSYLQNDPYVIKISKHITKKVADKLNELYKTDKNNFEKFWTDISPFIKFGMMNNADFYEKSKDIVIFPSSSGENTSIKEYLERNKESKDTVLYCTDKDNKSSHINIFKEEGLEIIFIDSVIDSHFINFLESKDTKIKYKSIDSEISEHLLDKTQKADPVDSKDNKTKNDKIAEIFKATLKKDKLEIKVESLKSEKTSAILTQAEQLKRMKDMSLMMKQKLPGNMFEAFTLVINSNSLVIKNILKLNQESNKKEAVELLCQQVYDLAFISQHNLTGDDKQAFIERTNKLLTKIST
jgi:molecular chaperone HtpG